MQLDRDNEASSPLGTITEGGYVVFRLTSDTMPTDPIIKLQARSAVKAYNDSSLSSWSGWSDVFSVLESKSTSINDKEMALKGLYSDDFTECCIKGGYWSLDSDTNKYYATYYIVSHDDNYVGEAERHYEFHIVGATAQKIKVIVHEDDAYYGHSYPDYVNMERGNGGINTDTTVLNFQLGRSHFEGYSINLVGTGPALAQSSLSDSGWVMNIGPDHEPYGVVSSADPPHNLPLRQTCMRDGDGFVTAYVTSYGRTFEIGTLKICH